MFGLLPTTTDATVKRNVCITMAGGALRRFNVKLQHEFTRKYSYLRMLVRWMIFFIVLTLAEALSDAESMCSVYEVFIRFSHA